MSATVRRKIVVQTREFFRSPTTVELGISRGSVRADKRTVTSGS